MQHTKIAAAILAALSANVLANTQPQLPAAEFTLDEIVVTATRTAQTVDETLAAVTVIDRKAIENAASLSELLAFTPALSVVNNGGAGKTTNVYVRGTQSSHVLVLVDGVKVGSATLGKASFQDIPLSMIERIEIVRGPASSLYGSEALGGVIQIFTRKGPGQNAASIGYGRYETRQAEVHLGVGDVDRWMNVNLSHFRTDGFNAVRGTELDADGYRNDAVTLRGSIRLPPSARLGMHLLRAEGFNKYDGPYSNEAKPVQQVIGLDLKYSTAPAWDMKLAWGQSRDESDAYKNGVYKSTSDTRRNTLSWQNDFRLGVQDRLVAGADYQDEHVNSSTVYAVKGRYNTGVFAQYLAARGVHDFKASLRHDENSQFGSSVTGNVAWGMDMGRGFRARLGYGTAFVAPTLNQLYYPASSTYTSNPSLSPEKSKSYEAGLSGLLPLGNWSLTFFDNQVEDMIVTSSGAGGLQINASSVRIQGIETGVDLRVSDWDVKLGLTLQDPENHDAAYAGKLLDRRAERLGSLSFDRTLGPWRIGATVRGESKRYDNLANTTKLAGYGRVDVRAEYRLEKDWMLQGRIENLFDKRYETANTYNQPGAGFYVILRYQPAK